MYRCKRSLRGRERQAPTQLLPALSSARLVSERARKVGFDWKDAKGVFKKIEEELKELRKAARRKDRKEVREEFGDLLFSLVNLARHLKVNPEVALRKATAKFRRRFKRMERELRKKGKRLDKATLKEMDKIWETIK